MLAAIAVGLAAGAALAPFLPDSPWLWLTGLLIPALLRGHEAAVARPGWSLIVRGLLVLALLGPAAAWHHRRQPRPARDDVSLLAPRRFVAIAGMVEAPPEGGDGRWRAVVRVLPTATGPPVSGRLAVRFPPGTARPSPGQGWQLQGRLLATEGPRNPGGFDAQAYWQARGVFALMQAEQATATGFGLRADDRARRALDHVRLALLAGLSVGLPPEKAALLGSLVLGSGAAPVPAALASVFREAGLAHVLAASGTQVSLLGGLLWWLARRLGLGSGASGALAALGLVGYLLLTGATPGMVRATWMGLIGLGGLVLGRSAVPFAAFWATLALILGADPTAVTDLGLQLSALATYALLRLAHAGYGPSEGWRRQLWAFGWAPCVTWLWVAPWQALSFGCLPLAGVPANWLAAPLVTLLTPWGLGLALLGCLAPRLVGGLAGLTGALVGGLIRVAEWAVAVPGQWWALPAVSAGAIAAAYAALFLGLRHPRAALLVSLGALVWWGGGRSPAVLRVAVLSVGQGDAIVIQTPAGRTLLVDGGPAARGADQGQRTVLPYLQRLGVKRLDLIVATHAHEDHLGGLPAVLARLPVSAVWENGRPEAGEAQQALLSACLGAGVTLTVPQANTQWQADGVRLQVLPRPPAPERENDASLVLRLHYGRTRLLLPGDLETTGEGWLAQRSPDELRAEVLKLGHHGARNATSAAWLARVRPRLALISVGRQSVHGHPHGTTLARLERSGVAVLRTDRDGAILLESDGQRWRTTTAASRWREWRSWVPPARMAGEPDP
ncbi:MAG: DNA internalization-related competence protein ComEC/Rec2 [Candidatus Sericytochromatia bacterium]|nr:DNA internalization-related competence protein ComEC/Rec2 [Candidatus Sericytochromatia bacterium]